MRYFVPSFKIASLSPVQDGLLSKLGGVPWGFPAERWPTCCGKPQKLLAQLCHDSPMLDLGGEGLVLHLFQCLECCGIDECGRSVVLIDRAALGAGLFEVPGHDSAPELGEPLIGELWIDGWTELDDGIPIGRLPQFFVEKDLWSLQKEFSEIPWFHPLERTKFGGSPRWTANGPQEYPLPPFEYLFQIDNDVPLEGPIPDANTVGCGITTFPGPKGSDSTYQMAELAARKSNAPWGVVHEETSGAWYAEFTNLGSDGVVYCFIDRSQSPPEVKWFWNR